MNSISKCYVGRDFASSYDYLIDELQLATLK